MPTISITKDTLMKAIAGEVKRQSFGMAHMNITFIEGIATNGETFEITGIRVQADPPKPKDFYGRTAPAGLGKIRLAASDGERV